MRYAIQSSYPRDQKHAQFHGEAFAGASPDACAGGRGWASEGTPCLTVRVVGSLRVAPRIEPATLVDLGNQRPFKAETSALNLDHQRPYRAEV